jgi:rod shape-determining protein MreC
VVGLVLLSLGLLTVSFRSSALDPVEGFSASVLRPFEVAGNKVARPFRDAANWTHGLFNAKAENRRLKKENAKLSQEVAQRAGAQNTNAQLSKLLHYVRSPSFPKDYDELAAQVLTSPSVLDQSITISAGSNRGIAQEDVVVTSAGLVGTISKVFATESRVTLITDSSSFVRALDEQNQAAVGMVDHGTGSSSLILDRIGKDKLVANNDEVVTAGSPSGSKLLSLFPRNIPIGVVTSAIRTDTDIYQDIVVQPFVDLSSLQTVLVLIPNANATGAATKKKPR